MLRDFMFFILSILFPFRSEYWFEENEVYLLPEDGEIDTFLLIKAFEAATRSKRLKDVVIPGRVPPAVQVSLQSPKVKRTLTAPYEEMPDSVPSIIL